MLGCCRPRKESNEPMYNMPAKGIERISGETFVMRHPNCVTGELPVFNDPTITTMAQIHIRNYAKYPERECLGHRALLPGKKDQYEDKFTWMTYKETIEQALAVGHAMKRLNLATSKNEFGNFNMKLVAIYSKNTKEYIIFDIAATLFNFTTVPIYDTLGDEALEFMYKQTNLETCFITCNHIKGLANMITSGRANKLCKLVILDEYNLNPQTDEILNDLKSNGCEIHKFSDLLIKEGDCKMPEKSE